MHEQVKLKLKFGLVASDDLTPGYQSEIFNSPDTPDGGKIIKVFDNPNAVRNQKYGGSYEEAKFLVALMERYRNRLREVGFAVPSREESMFLVGELEHTGAFVPVESVKNFGVDAGRLLADADGQGKAEIVGMILDVAYPVLMADGLGADIKPANFVVCRQTSQLFHVDPLPVLMKDETSGLVLTEWPPIIAPEIQPFLEQTHLTPLAIGFRFYQELCQCDPGNRTLFQRAIGTVLDGWVREGRMAEAVAGQVREAMVPASSRILAQMLDGEMSQEEGEGAIRSFITGLSAPGSHPIYALREMAFLLTERLLQGSSDLAAVSVQALNMVERDLGRDKRGKIAAAVNGVTPDLRFLTVIRKLTHLSDTDWVAGKDEGVALSIIMDVASRVS